MASKCSPDFFDVTGIPDWLEDETLFSLTSRFHHLSCNMTASATSNMLFGSAKRGYQHDLPSGVAAFSRATSGQHGTAHSIIQKHTLLPYYLPFRTSHDTEDAYSAMAGPSIGSLKYRLGILTSRFRAHHPLKACTTCMLEDLEKCSVAYWHLSHQYPGVWLCLKHHQQLLTCTLKSTGVSRFQWVLPHKDNLTHAGDGDSTINDNTLSLLKNLASASISLSQLPKNFHFDAKRLLNVYHAKLKQDEFITHGGCLRLEEIAESYIKTIRLPQIIDEFSALATTKSDAKQQIGKLLRLPRAGTHPLRHLTLILWLFKDWPSFWKAYQAWDENDLTVNQPQTINNKTSHHKYDAHKKALINLINNKNHSITKAAKIVGVDTNTAMAWASQCGITISHRPKLLKPKIRKNLIRDLKSGKNKSVLSEKYGVSTQTISAVLRTEIGLHQEWSDARFNKRLKKERTSWKKMVRANGELGIKAVRMLAPSTYAWLYRNDRTWLSEQNHALPKIRMGNNASVNWDVRDTALSTQVKKLALKLSMQNTSTTLSLGLICQQIPELKPKLERLSCLPLTYKALQSVLGKKFRRKNKHNLI